MSQISTTPVLKCKRCGRMMIVTSARTFTSDPEKTVLMDVMRAVADVSLCQECEKRRIWYINQGRLEDWEAGRP